MAEGNGTTTAQHVEDKPEKAGTIQAPRSPLAFMPQSWDDAWRIAGYLEQTGLTPDALRGKRHDILYIIATGHEFGLNPIQAMREIVIVKGKPYLSALLRIGMVKQAPECEYFRLLESDDKKATFETKRKGEGVTKLTYTIEDAKRAGLYGRVDKDGKLLDDNWNKTPALMLRRRCGSQLADEVYPDRTRGTRDREDLEEEQQRERELNAPPIIQNMGKTSAPPPPQEAEVVEAKSTPPKRPHKPLTVVMDEPKPTQSEAVKAAGGITTSDMDKAGDPPVPPTEMDEYEKFCARLLECQTPDDVDNLVMKTDATKWNDTERKAMSKLIRDRRAALVKQNGGK